MPRHALLEAILKEAQNNNGQTDRGLIEKSFFFCIEAHGDQKRVSGEPYWTHPANAALILAQLGADSETLAAALLHDVLEDTAVSEHEMEKRFGKSVTEMVKGVTKLDRLSRKGNEQYYQAANIQKLLLAGSKDLRVLAIKLADKLHNLRTLGSCSKKDQLRIATQALMVFAPLAHKLGIHDLKWGIEDRAFFFANPSKYREVSKKSAVLCDQRKKAIRKMRQLIALKSRHLVLDTREKNPYSLYVKMAHTGKSLEALTDTCILTIQARDIADCYAALGLLHSLFLPVPNKVKDYIAIPQSNLYQALHTTVIGPGGAPIKAYIFTEEMLTLFHRGILALKGSLAKTEVERAKKRAEQLNQFFSLPGQFDLTAEFMKSLTEETLSKSIFVFTPKGDIVELPFGSTPVDFAFKVEPGIGQRLWRAKVNGKFVGLDARLENGNVVEIIPSRLVQLDHKWLDYANTLSAKKTIEKHLKRRQQYKHSMDFLIRAKDRVGLISNISYVFETEHVNISGAIATIDDHNEAFFQVNVPLLPSEKARDVAKQLRNIKGILKVEH